jgi:hypothetical protein
MTDYEKLGVFYLGRPYDAASRTTLAAPLLYDAKDLTTHGVCVGMTGSGKTGLCLAVIEEAAVDGIPVIAVDPKGDLANLLLTFPDLDPADFLPWVDPGEALREGLTPEALARRTAQRWRQGLADWGQDGARIRRLRESAEMVLYTPGATFGRPLSVLRSLASPGTAAREDADLLAARVNGAVDGLLTLLGQRGEPLQSREHILLSAILHHAWSQGRDLDLPALIRLVQTPPFERVGVFDLETFFGARDRMALAMALNALLAAPGFAAWMQGDPLDIGRLLHSANGRPRVTILSIAHLSEAERMFFVTLLLNEVLAWVRTQPGTSSLRALLYMDEIAGFFPPTANPPAKPPMLTLLKQARAYGLGVLLATQNPVDLDYKGLSNAGTWFVGRLQTERDRLRLLDGLESAGGGAFDRQRLEALLAGLPGRVFLLHNVHEKEPVLFQTRWVMSYLRGPLTRPQIAQLAATAAPEPPTAPSANPSPPAGPPAAAAAAGERPMLPAGTPEFFIAPRSACGDGFQLLYRPALAANVRLHFVNARAKVDVWQDLALRRPLAADASGEDWGPADLFPDGHLDLEPAPQEGAVFEPPPAAALGPRSLERWRRALAAFLYRERPLSLWKAVETGALSLPGEPEGEFRSRLALTAREARDRAAEQLKRRYEGRFNALQDRIRRLEHRLERETEQYTQQKFQTTVSIGATLLGALLGRRTATQGTLGRAATAARGLGRAGREKGDVDRAREELEAARAQLAALEAEFQAAAGDLAAPPDPAALPLEPVTIPCRKADTEIADLGLAWIPWRRGPDGRTEPLA